MTVMETQVFTGELVIERCYKCGVIFGLEKSRYNRARRSGDEFFCTNGHGQVYAETREQALEKKLTAQRARAERAEIGQRAARDQAAAAERSKAALKGHLTRARNKIAAGSCPVPDCGQHFSNVREHMKHKHPDWHLTDPETGKVAAL